MKTKLTRVAWLLVALSLALTACGSESVPTTNPNAPIPDPIKLAGTRWVATAMFLGGAQVPFVANATPTLEFADNGRSAAGTTGCNSWFAEVTLGANTVTFGGIGMTEMACEEPLMTQEGNVASVLEAASIFTLVDNKLTVGQVGGSAIEFIPRAVAMPDAELTGTEWIADTLLFGDAAQTLVPGTTISLIIEVDGTVSGSGGCNAFTGSAEVDGNTIRFGDMSITEIGCVGEGIMQQEELVMSVLTAQVEFAIDGERMTLFGPGDTGLSFSAG